jgi:hypothetical protein
VIDIGNEQLIRLTDLSSRIPPHNGKRLALQTVYRWSLHGCKGVRLETVQLGGTRFTTLEAFQRFCDALTVARDGRPAAERHPAGAAARRRQDEIEKQLDAIGV